MIFYDLSQKIYNFWQSSLIYIFFPSSGCAMVLLIFFFPVRLSFLHPFQFYVFFFDWGITYATILCYWKVISHPLIYNFYCYYCCFSLMCILKKQTVFRMPWNSSYIFLTKSNEPMLENLKQILQGVSSLVLKIVFCVHLGKLRTIEGLTTFFPWTSPFMQLLIKVSFLGHY